MSTQLEQIAAKAKKDRAIRFTSLAHVLTPAFLIETWQQMNRRGASGAQLAPSAANTEVHTDQQESEAPLRSRHSWILAAEIYSACRWLILPRYHLARRSSQRWVRHGNITTQRRRPDTSDTASREGANDQRPKVYDSLSRL